MKTKPKTLFELYDGDSFPRSCSVVSTFASWAITAETNWVGIAEAADDYGEFLKWKANQRKEKELESKPMEVPKRLITVE